MAWHQRGPLMRIGQPLQSSPAGGLDNDLQEHNEMTITLHDSVEVEGREWKLQKIDFTLDGKTFSAYFYALSREHASYMFEAIKENGLLGDEIIATGKFDT